MKAICGADDVLGNGKTAREYVAYFLRNNPITDQQKRYYSGESLIFHPHGIASEVWAEEWGKISWVNMEGYCYAEEVQP